MSQAQREPLTGIEEMIADAVEGAMVRRFNLSADALSDAEWLAIERLVLLRIATGGMVAAAMRDAADRAVDQYAEANPAWRVECRDAAREVAE